jgi:hypothetical protein
VFRVAVALHWLADYFVICLIEMQTEIISG